MPAQWTGEIVGKMHINGITIKALATHMNMTHEYVGKVLSGKAAPKDAERRFTAALDELIKEREVGNGQ